MMTSITSHTMLEKKSLIASKSNYTPIILELVNREFANTSVKVSIEALQIVVCKCTKDCFRYYIQNRDFRITGIWLDSFIKENKLDEKYSFKQTPNSAFRIDKNPSKVPVYQDYLPTSAKGCPKLLKTDKITKQQVELEMQIK